MARNHPHAIERPHHFQIHLGALATNTNFAAQVPILCEWKVISVHIRFTTDANAADRHIRIEYTAAGQPDYAASNNALMTASTQFDLWWGIGNGWFNNLFTQGLVTNTLPDGHLIPALGELRTRIDNMQVGDRINAVDYNIYQYLDPVHA